MTATEVERFLRELPKGVRAIVVALRRTIREIGREVEETVLWGGLSYHRPAVGGRVKGAVCQISVRSGAVKLEFIHGIRLPDPRRLLKGERLSKRHVVVRNVEDAGRPGIVELIRAAATLRIEDTGPRSRGTNGVSRRS